MTARPSFLAQLQALVLFALAALAAMPAAPVRASDVPFLSGHVNDTAHLLTPEQAQAIEAKLTQYESETSHQIAVLTIDSLDGDPIEDYSHRVAETWKLGTKDKDDGALLLVSKGDRKMRIEVGYGLEANLTDLQTSIIQNEIIIPEFKKNDYGTGIAKGVDAIVDTLKGKEPQPTPRPAAGGERRGLPTGILFAFLFFLFPFSWEAIQRRSWMLYVFFLPFYFFLGSLIAPLVGMIASGLWALVFPLLMAFLPKGKGPRSGGGSGGWWFPGAGGGGGWGRGGGSWGGGGGGGFSGGGGSFGGGGSSSSW